MHHWTTPCRLSTLLAAAADASDAEASLMVLLEGDDRLVIMLLGALATGRLFEKLEFDGEPILRLTKKGLALDLLEIKSSAQGGLSGGTCKVVTPHVLEEDPALL